MSSQLQPPEDFVSPAAAAAARAELQAIERELERRRQQDAWYQSVPVKLRALAEPHRYKGAHGGRGGAKSHHFAEQLVQTAKRRKGFRAVCVREIQKSLEQSVKRLLEDKIRKFGFEDSFKILNTQIGCPGDGVILFQGMQDHTADSIKSLEGMDVAWVEEAQVLSDHSLTLLRPTIRKEGSEIWFSWNPRFPDDPVDAFFRSGNPPPDSVCVEVSFHDNPYLPEELKREIDWDKARDLDKYNHVWLGQYKTQSEARVFKNWRVEEFESPQEADFLLGSDWGFSVDPSVLVRCFFRDKRTLCIDYEAYEIGCEIEDSPALFDSLLCGEACSRPRSSCRRPEHGWARKWLITADSARPETISHMQRHGYPKMEASIKGAKSVEEGVSFLQSYDIVVHPRCERTIDELGYYAYKQDALTGKVLPVLLDKKNHVIDSLRYAVERVRRELAKSAFVW